MSELTMTVGPKGQVVIPKGLRDEYGISPGDDVLFDGVEEGVIIRKPIRNVAKEMRKIALSGKGMGKIDLDEEYSKRMLARWEANK